MIVGTAGHIDHGKTTLVRALTGVETDRLKEEKARGISIDLGFAYWPQPDGSVIGFVDVPGHEALIHNMLAGATGIDTVLLVVAADDGIMPQTREHLAIMELLGLESAIIALNKSDRVDEARQRQVADEIRAALAGTAFANAPIIPVSGVTGAGIDVLKDALRRAAAVAKSRPLDGLFRLAVDRTFTLKGHGTAVTGIILSGRISVGDSVMLTPSGLPVRVRSLHAQNAPAETATAGQRTALVLAGEIGKDRIHRGDMVVDPALHAPANRIDVALRVLATEPKAIGIWFPVKFHHGTSEVSGRLVPLDTERIAPGGMATCQIVLERPIAICSGDRFVVRDTSSSRTIGGGVVVDVRAPERRRRTPVRLATLECLRERNPSNAVQCLLRGPQPWLMIDALLRDRGLPLGRGLEIAKELGALPLQTPEGLCVFDGQAWDTLGAEISRRLDAEHADRPDLPGVTREKLRSSASLRLPISVFNAALAALAGQGVLSVDRSWVRRPSHQVRFSPEEEALWKHIWPRLIREPYKPPRVRDIAKAMEIDESLVRRLMKMAARRGDVDEVAHDHYFARPVVAGMAAIAADCARSGERGEFTVASFRDRLDNGRKVAIHILEYFDRHGYTIRRKDMRRINSHRASLFAAETTDATATAHDNGGVPLPVGRPDFKSGWGRQTASGGFDSHPPPPIIGKTAK